MHLTMNAGMDLRKALRLSLRNTGSVRYTDAADKIDATIAAGNSIYEAFYEAGCFPPDFLDSVEVGEHSGRLVESMAHLSRQYQEQARAALATLTMVAGIAVWGLVAILIICLIFRLAFFYIGVINGADEVIPAHERQAKANAKCQQQKLRRATRLGPSRPCDACRAASHREMIADEAEVEADRPQPLDLLGVEPARLIGRPLHHDPIAELAIFGPALRNVAVPGLAAKVLKRREHVVPLVAKKVPSKADRVEPGDSFRVQTSLFAQRTLRVHPNAQRAMVVRQR